MADKRQADGKVLIASSVHVWNDLRVYYKEALTISQLAPTKLIGVANEFTPDDNNLIEIELLPAADSGGVLHKLGTRAGRHFRIARELLNNNYRVFHFHDPELMFAGWLAKLRGCKVIYDVHEDAMHMLQGRDWLSGNMAWILGRLVRMLEWISAKIFDELILAERSYARYYSPKKTSLVLNYPIQVQGLEAAGRQPDEPLKLVYAGSLTQARGIGDLIAAVRDLVAEDIPVQLDLYGGCREPKLMEMIVEAEQYNVAYQGWIPVLELMNVLSKYHVGISPLHDLPNYRHSFPTKILDYLSVGIPVVTSNLASIADELGDSIAICTYAPGDIEGLKKAIASFTDEDVRQQAMSKAGSISANYSWESQSEVLRRVYHRLLTE